MEEEFRKRIDYEGDIELISQEICKDYKLGAFKSNKLVLQGYEDLNLILETKNGKYFVKLFANFRDIDNCHRYMEIIIKALESNISTPKLLKSEQGFFHQINLNGKKLRLCVMEYIEGTNFYESKRQLSEDQIRFLSKQASMINSISLKPFLVYDSWAITNFEKEFDKKAKYLSVTDLALIQQLAVKFKEIDLETLPHCFVHGDLINTNVIQDNNSNLFIIDFSVSNYYPRIQELAVLACNLFFDQNSISHSERNLNIALDEYQKNIRLTEQELDLLPLYIQFAHAMHLLSANYEKVANHNNSEENEYWLQLGRSGLIQTYQTASPKI